MSMFIKYMNQYNTTLSEAFADRDFPMTADDIREEWKEIKGVYPSEEELNACSPDTIQCKRSYYDEENLD